MELTASRRVSTTWCSTLNNSGRERDMGGGIRSSISSMMSPVICGVSVNRKITLNYFTALNPSSDIAKPIIDLFRMKFLLIFCILIVGNVQSAIVQF